MSFRIPSRSLSSKPFSTSGEVTGTAVAEDYEHNDNNNNNNNINNNDIYKSTPLGRSLVQVQYLVGH